MGKVNNYWRSIIPEEKFYESHGFVQSSEMYLEDVPHIEMKKE
jgi:predicted GNAT family N-acyltransferase